MQFKKKLAFEIVKQLNNEDAAQRAADAFESRVQKKEIPDAMEEIQGTAGELLVDVLVAHKVLVSKGEWRRLVEQNAIHNLENDTTITDVTMKLSENLTLKIGKKRFIKIIIK